MTAPGPHPPPGWYPDGRGQVRWWTGATWGAYAPVASPYPPPAAAPYRPPVASRWYGGPPPYPGAAPGARTDAKTMSMLAHLGMLLAGFVVPLVIYLTAGKDDPFVRHHSSEALNFAITYLAASFAVMPLFFVGVFVPPLLLIIVPAVFTLVIGHFVWLVMASVKASHGEWWRYPVCIRIVAGTYGA